MIDFFSEEPKSLQSRKAGIMEDWNNGILGNPKTSKNLE